MSLIPTPHRSFPVPHVVRAAQRGATIALLLFAGDPVLDLALRGADAGYAALAQGGSDVIRPAAITDLAISSLAGTGRVAVYRANPRYLQDANGQPLVLVGFGDEFRNSRTVLDQLAGKVNFERAYAMTTLRTADPNDYALGLPWPVAGGRADLATWNETYWNNLRDHLAATRDRGIIVGLTLWDGHGDMPGGKSGDQSIFNASYNLQGVQWVWDANLYTQYPNPSPNGSAGEKLVFYQRRFMDRLLSELAAFPNVVIELDNETSSAAPAWWLWWAGYILARGEFVIATSWYEDYTIPDAVFAADPRLHMKSYHSRSDDVITPSRWAWGKVIVADADNSCANLDRDSARRMAWRSVVRGGHWNDFVCGGDPFPDAVKIGDYGRLLDFLKTRTVPLWDMVPRNDLVSSGLAMALPGSRYLVYTESNVTVDLSAVAGTVSWQWYDPKNGATVASGTVSGGATRPFTIPGARDYVLWITK